VTGTNYTGKCGLYGGVCELKCEAITGDDNACNITRSSDCFLILANSSKGVDSNTCVDKV
jgi:hypothetical protein